MEMMSSVRNENSRFPFTSNQWQELEHQALVYKYMISGMPIPPRLLFSIKTSLDSSTKLFMSPTLQSIGWKCFEMGFGRKIDPEPGRCRRTDGKKWRCSKEAYPDSKYCERHMHRGRNRSRKPVEVVVVNKSPNYPSPKTTTSSSLPTRCGNVMSSQHDHFLLESSLYSHSQKDITTSYGMKKEVDERRFLSETCGTVSMGDSWHLEPLTMNNSSSLSSLSSSKQRSFSDYRNDYLYQGRCYDDLALKIERKGEPQKVTHHFFDDSPHKDKDSSTTQLSISIPGHAHDFFLTHNDK